MIVCAGEHDSGKTTLLSSIYEMFQDGAVGDLAFAGSATLHGFEQRCHKARVTSELAEPKTERTKPGEGFRFLHLGVWASATKVSTDLLLGDMSGELYRSLGSSSEECKKYGFFRRADHFVVLLDAEQVTDGFHAEAFSNAATLVRALLDSELLGDDSCVTLLTTKWDVVTDESGEIVADLEERFRRMFEQRVGEVTCLRVAARPADGGEPMGLDALLAHWLAKSKPLPFVGSPKAPSVRAFDLFSEVAGVLRLRRGAP